MGKKDHIAEFWGSYDCDIPKVMVESAVDFVAVESRALMAGNGGVPIPVLWTGDSGPHKLTQDDASSSLAALLTTSRTLQDVLPTGTPVFPTLGNLDVFPNGQLPDVESTELLAVVADAWAPWLTLDALAQFRSTGYYAQGLPGTNLTVLSLNTVLWYKENQLSRPNLDDDPLNQFDWLKARLAAAVAVGAKVILMGHIPPQNFHDQYNAEYVKILRKYSDAIYALVFAHWHENMISLLWDESAYGGDGAPISGAPIAAQFSGSSVTSRKHRNPAVRLYSASLAGGILDYTVYRTVLEADNAANKTSWAPYFSACEAYPVDDLSVASVYKLYLKLYASKAPTPGAPSLWQTFVGEHLIANAYTCDASCGDELLAKMECIDMTTTTDCGNIPDAGCS